MEQYHDSIFWVEVDRIVPNPFQPRRDFDEERLRDLAESIRQYGVLQPLVVTRKETQREDGGISVTYELIAGERRLRASKIAGLSQVPVIIRVGEETDQMKLELAIIENLQREDINAIDRAKAFQKLSQEFGLKNTEIGKRIGKSREYVSNTIRLLTLPDEIQLLIAEGKITEGHTRPLLMLSDRPDEQKTLAKEIIIKKLTVRESEHIARRIAHDRIRKKGTFSPELVELEKELTEHLGTRVHLEPRPVGGKLVISYFSHEDLKVILDMMHVSLQADLAGALESVTREFTEGTQAAPNQEAQEGKPVAAEEQAVRAVQGEAVASEVAEVVAAAGVGEMPEPQSEESIYDDPDLLDDRTKNEREEQENEDSDMYSVRNFSL